MYFKEFSFLLITCLLSACGGSSSESANSSSSSSSSSGASTSTSSSSSASSSSSNSSSTSSSSSSSSSSGANKLPLCDQASNNFPYCQKGAFTDPDGDGWGWENEMSCVVPNGATDPNPNSCRIEIVEASKGNSPTFIDYNGKEVYLNGFNVAWLDFAADFGKGINEPRLRELLQDAKDSGVNSIRWWVHVDGSTTPTWSEQNGVRLVDGSANLIDDMNKALDIAAEYEVYIIPALWSFDMLRDNDFRKPPTQDNYRLLSDDIVLQSYIDNALVPMVKALNKHPQLLAWELFNEPENMTEKWFREEAVFYGGPIPTMAQLQRTQAKMAAAIHKAAIDLGETALVTTGSKSMGKYNSDVAGGTNFYRDDRMIEAADGDPLAVLDFYEPHYYNNEGLNGAWSPFHHDANYWSVDKPIVIGEFYVQKLDVLNDPVEKAQLCQRLKDKGYAGGWSWQWWEYHEDVKTCASELK